MAIENRGPQVHAVLIPFIILSWIAVGLRCYVKLFITKSFRIDDWLAIAALASFNVFCAVTYAGSQPGLGIHVYDLSEEQFSKGMMWFFAGELSYVTTTAVVKAAIGALLLQICVNRYQKMTIWIVVIIVALFSFGQVIFLIFQCNPISSFWTRFLGKPGKCISGKIISNLAYGHTTIVTAADLTLGILPIFLVRNLKLNLRTKISVALILALNSVGSISSIIRYPILHVLTETDDFLWANVPNAIMATVEVGTGVIASSLATLRPLFITFLGRTKPANGSYTQSLSQDGYFSTMPKGDDLELRPDFSKSIHVKTTVMNSEARRIKKPQEVFKRLSESVRVLNGDSKWYANLETESVEEVGHRTFIEGGQAV